CFFFQAEDGIRDSSVTGVQTCALPISTGASAGSCGGGTAYRCGGKNTIIRHRTRPTPTSPSISRSLRSGRIRWQSMTRTSPYPKIGRASCRERVEITEGDITSDKQLKE